MTGPSSSMTYRLRIKCDEMNIPAATSASDKAYYDQDFMPSPAAHGKWMEEIRGYFKCYSARLNLALEATGGRVAELGAGSCGLSLCISALPHAKQVYALDISLLRMKRMIELSVAVLGSRVDGVEIISCDFNGALPFKDGELGAVVFDAALHHSRSIWSMLTECRRVLCDGGLLIAQREAYLSPLRAAAQIRRLLRTPEIAANVSENIYLREQYQYYLTVHGFDVEFIPHSTGRLKRLLRILNGSLFSDGVLYATKRPVGTPP